MIDPDCASVEIDLAAYRANLSAIAELVAPAEVMAVVKADAYGHGMRLCAPAARQAGITWLGVATPTEALALRQAGDDGRILAWLYGPGEDLTAAVASDIDLAVSGQEELARVVMAAGTSERTARVHLKIDTGLSRNGSSAGDWAELCVAAREAEQHNVIEVVGIWSHFATAEEVDHPATPAQLAAFERALAVAEEMGLNPSVRHIANSAGALAWPQARYDLVRIGIAGYGLDPGDGVAERAGLRLQPVLRLRARLVRVKPISAGAAVSYGHSWTADRDTTVGLVPMGYAEGIDRMASNVAEVALPDGSRVPIRGRVCMDQFVVDLGPHPTVTEGDEVTVIGDGTTGPHADEWADWCHTINYEIVTRLGVRLHRVAKEDR
ncbi:alanine racemase [Enemella sp. A6]|uniref:alanine racemase n=1 Tax=Enemella sp. A6 TaxID=3440152 RepID=UPI003EB6DFAD